MLNLSHVSHMILPSGVTATFSAWSKSDKRGRSGHTTQSKELASSLLQAGTHVIRSVTQQHEEVDADALKSGRRIGDRP